jgi:hypothetical protein
VETNRRERREPSFVFARVFWWFRFTDEYPVISAPFGTKASISKWLSGKHDLKRIPSDTEADELMEIINADGNRREKLRATRKYWHKVYLCDGNSMRTNIAVQPPASLVRIEKHDLRYENTINAPEHCIPDGVAFGICVDDQIVSVAIAHRTELMEDIIADLGAETAERYRRRGYARAAVHAVTNHYTSEGGEAWYECSPNNKASQATALSVGYRQLAESLSLRTESIVESS